MHRYLTALLVGLLGAYALGTFANSYTIVRPTPTAALVKQVKDLKAREAFLLDLIGRMKGTCIKGGIFRTPPRGESV